MTRILRIHRNLSSLEGYLAEIRMHLDLFDPPNHFRDSDEGMVHVRLASLREGIALLRGELWRCVCSASL